MNPKVRDWIAYAFLIVLILVVFFYILKPTFTGMVVGIPEEIDNVEQSVINELDDNDYVEVMIMLKEPEVEELELPIQEIKSSRKRSVSYESRETKGKILEKRKQKIKITQDQVLSDLNYVKESENRTSKRKGKMSRITGWIISDGEFEDEPDLELSNKYETVSALSGRLSKEGIEKLKDNPLVERIALVKIRQIQLDASVPLINATTVHSMNLSGIKINGSGQSVCVLDTGVDYNHNDLGGGWGNKVIAGYDTYWDDSDPMDDHGHGTHVAGIIAASGGITGVAPGANIVAIKVCNSTGGCPTNKITAGIDWCINNSVNYSISVISMSLGGSRYPIPCDYHPNVTETPFINRAVEEGIFVSVASGNEYDGGMISAPACISNATSVGATTKSDVVSVFSNAADFLDVLAPGQSIQSTLPGNSYGYKDGTSMATPHVAGAAALIYQYEALLNNRNATPHGVREILKRTGKQIYDSRNGLTFPRIDVLRAINSYVIVNTTENIIEDQTGNAQIDFGDGVDLTHASEALIVGHNFISLNAEDYPELNKSANLTLYNLTYNKTPVILKNDKVCLDCSVISYDGDFKFSVSGFSNYTSGVNSQLYIFDDEDNGSLVRTYENVSFYANYTNRTSGQPINAAGCNISFDDGTNDSMSYANGLFVFSNNWNFADKYVYNVICSHTDFETLNISDDINILAGCGIPQPNVDWKISSNTTIICSEENLFFQNQSLIIGPNSTFIMQDSSLVLNESDNDKNIIINQSATFIVNNSIIRSKVMPTKFYLESYGNLSVINSKFNGSVLNIRGNKSNILTNLTSYDFIYVPNNGINNMISLNAYAKVFFESESYNLINTSYFYAGVEFNYDSVNMVSDSFFDSAEFRSTSITNFTLPQSNISNDIIVVATPIVDGYIDMPDSASLVLGTLTRYYPLYVNYTNSSPAINKLVNITDSSTELWSGYTTSLGLVSPNLDWAFATKDNKYNLTVNPTINISLLTDTPIQFLLDTPDTSPPIVTPISPANNSAETDENITFEYSVTDVTGIENCSLILNSEFNNTNLTVATGVSQEFNVNTLPIGLYNWSVRCFDNSTDNNMAESGIMYFEVVICGDSIIGTGEACDSANMGGVTCTNLGYDKGTVSCTASCTLDKDCENNNGGGNPGGGGIIEGCIPNWDCTDWGECVDSLRTRTCTDTKGCDDLSNEPLGELTCVVPDEPEDDDPEPDNPVDPIASPAVLEKDSEPGDSGVLPHCSNKIRDEDEVGVDCGGRDCILCETPVTVGQLWWLWVLAIILIYFIIPKRIVFADEETLQDLIKHNTLKKYSKVYVTEKIYKRYKKKRNLRFMIYIEKKDKGLIKYLKNEFKLDENLAETVALANRKLFTHVLTHRTIPVHLKKEFIRVKFTNPFKEKKHILPSASAIKHHREMHKINKEIEEIASMLEKY